MKSLKLWLLACAASLALGCGGVPAVEADAPEPSNLMSREDAVNYCTSNTDCRSYETCLFNRCLVPCTPTGTCPSTTQCCRTHDGYPANGLCYPSAQTCPGWEES